MKPVGRLKEDVEQAETKEEKRELIENAGMELDDEELDQIAGGRDLLSPSYYEMRFANMNRSAK